MDKGENTKKHQRRLLFRFDHCCTVGLLFYVDFWGGTIFGLLKNLAPTWAFGPKPCFGYRLLLEINLVLGLYIGAEQTGVSILCLLSQAGLGSHCSGGQHLLKCEQHSFPLLKPQAMDFRTSTAARWPWVTNSQESK